MLQVLKNFIDNNILHHVDKALDKPNVYDGLIEEPVKKMAKRGDYGIATIDLSASRIIKEDGDLSAFSPEGEQQNIDFEKMWCVSENGICNPVETVINYFISLGDKADDETKKIVEVFRHFGFIKDNKCLIDTAYVAVGSGTTKRGNSYQKVADFVKKYGLIPKGMFPNYGKWRNWNELYYGNYNDRVVINGNYMPKHLIDRGEKLLKYIKFGYSWYLKDSKSANQKGCPGTSCGAWGYPDNDGIYRPVGIPINHAINRPKPIGKYRYIKDSYNPFDKKLSLDYPVGYDFLMSIRLKKEISDFNQEYLKELKSKGIDYQLLVGNIGEYKQGVYEITDDFKLKKVEGNSAIDKWITKMADEKKLQPRSPEDFKKLINII